MDKGRNIRAIGSDIGENEMVLEAGTLLTAAEIGLLATVSIFRHALSARLDMSEFECTQDRPSVSCLLEAS